MVLENWHKTFTLCEGSFNILQNPQIVKLVLQCHYLKEPLPKVDFLQYTSISGGDVTEYGHLGKYIFRRWGIVLCILPVCYIFSKQTTYYNDLLQGFFASLALWVGQKQDLVWIYIAHALSHVCSVIVQSPTQSHGPVHTAGGYGGGEMGQVPLTQSRQPGTGRVSSARQAQKEWSWGRNIHAFAYFHSPSTPCSPSCPAPEIHLNTFSFPSCLMLSSEVGQLQALQNWKTSGAWHTAKMQPYGAEDNHKSSTICNFLISFVIILTYNSSFSNLVLLAFIISVSCQQDLCFFGSTGKCVTNIASGNQVYTTAVADKYYVETILE